MPRRFAHLLPLDVVVWERYLSRYGQNYSMFEYDVRVGLGRDPGSDYSDNIRSMGLDLSMRRIDCVCHKQSSITVVEVTHTAGFKALGQIYGYPILYVLTFQPSLPVKSLLVCEKIQSDLRPVLDSLEVNYLLI